MKHLFSLLVFFGMLLTACNTFDESFVKEPEGVIPISIDGGITQIPTRATAEGFVDGDAVGIYVVNYEEGNKAPGILLDKGNQADHIQYTYIEAERRWQPSQVIYYKNEQTNVDIYAYYPYSRPDNVSSFVFELQKDQSAPAEGDGLSGYEASDFLWGKAENVVPTTNKVKINYTHRLACANVILQEGEGFVDGEFDLLEKTVIVSNTTRKASIDLSTGIATPISEIPSAGTVMMPCADGFRAIVVPQTVAAFKPLFSITLGGINYNFKRDDDFEFPAGQISRFTITVNKKTVDGTYEFVLSDSDIMEWTEDSETHMGEARQYYVVNLTEPGTLGKYLREEKKNPAKIKNLKLTGTIDARDFFFMRDTMSVLQAVNLKEAKIAACEIFDEWGYSTINYAANEIPDGAFENKSNLSYFAFPDDITRIGSSAFKLCSLLSGALVIPDTVTEVGAWAFYNCINLTSLYLPFGLKIIDYFAFYDCSSLTGTLVLPETLKKIGDAAFYNCKGFTGSLILPNALEYIGSSAFGSCKGFTGSLEIPFNVKELYGGTFAGCSGFRGQLILHDDLQFVMDGGENFDECSFTGELVLPSGLTKIPRGTFRYCLFSSIAGFPEGLLEIGESAFYGCGRLSGVLEFPETLVSLGSWAFEGCRTLEGIVLPANLGLIREGAFEDCFYINSITCKAIEPPTVLSGAFDGVPKDNFTLEVPEQAINRYQADSQWGEFKRISAFRDFSISRRLVRTLNVGSSNEFVVRALEGESWSVESKPEWVEVSPASGTGKTDVTITVSELAKGSADRKGDVVFLLDGKDYRVRTKVEQYDYEYGDGDVLTLQTATKGAGVNIVLMGDCYDAIDISEGYYLNDVKEAYGYMFDVEPYKSYKDYFNVYTVFGLSNDSGVGTTSTIREAKFGSQYQIAEGVAPDEQICFEYACKAPINNDISKSLIILIPNTTDYGGICYMWGDGSAIALCPKSSDAYPYDFRGIVQHEAGGHGFGKLADEYIYHNAFIESCSCGDGCEHVEGFNEFKNIGWYKNLSLSGNMDEVDWSHLIYHPKYANMVDMYEGGFFHSRGVYRSEPNSCMNNNIPYFSAISRQAIVERIKEYAGEEFTLEEFYANDVLTVTGVTGTKSFGPDVPLLNMHSKQYPPKYMGDKPDFNPNK